MTVSVSGAVLSPEDLASLNVSLPLLKDTTASKHVGVWGKITGTQRDYYIAWTTTKNVMGERKWHFCHDARNWQLLPKVNQVEAEALERVASHKFSGDTAFEYEAATVSGQKAPLNEEKRLAYTVQRIQDDTCIAPRGAYIQLADGSIIANKSFEGLSNSELSQLSSWLHLRTPKDPNCENIISRPNIDTTRDIFENLQVDTPKGVWSIQSERGASVFVVRSWLWPGAVAYHQADISGNISHGWMYIGDGSKSVDIGFQI